MHCALGGLVTHLYRLAEAHLVAEEYPPVPSLNGSGHSLALERKKRVLEGRCRRHPHRVHLRDEWAREQKADHCSVPGKRGYLPSLLPSSALSKSCDASVVCNYRTASSTLLNYCTYERPRASSQRRCMAAAAELCGTTRRRACRPWPLSLDPSVQATLDELAAFALKRARGATTRTRLTIRQ